MQPAISHLVSEVDLNQVSAALSAWSWLLGEGVWSPLLVSAAGDVFLANTDGVFHLDTGSGTLEKIAESENGFKDLLLDPLLARDWLLAPVVDELRAAGMELEPGQCYGFTILPVFVEGSYKADNRFVLSVAEHLRITGSIHSQIKDVADGDKVRIEVIK